MTYYLEIAGRATEIHCLSLVQQYQKIPFAVDLWKTLHQAPRLRESMISRPFHAANTFLGHVRYDP